MLLFCFYKFLVFLGNPESLKPCLTKKGRPYVYGREPSRSTGFHRRRGQGREHKRLPLWNSSHSPTPGRTESPWFMMVRLLIFPLSQWCKCDTCLVEIIPWDPYSRSIFLLLVPYSINHVRYSTLSYEIGFVLDDFCLRLQADISALSTFKAG